MPYNMSESHINITWTSTWNDSTRSNWWGWGWGWRGPTTPENHQEQNQQVYCADIIHHAVSTQSLPFLCRELRARCDPSQPDALMLQHCLQHMSVWPHPLNP